jgi:hypothetical protein
MEMLVPGALSPTRRCLITADLIRHASETRPDTLRPHIMRYELYLIFQQVLGLVLLACRASVDKDIELLVLRHEVAVLRRINPLPRMDWADGGCSRRAPAERSRSHREREPTDRRPRHAMGCRPSGLIHIQQVRSVRASRPRARQMSAYLSDNHPARQLGWTSADVRHAMNFGNVLVIALRSLPRDEQVKGFNPVIAASER